MIEELKKRDRYVDIAKGLGIIFVIMGHSDFPGFDKFHMPLFFILSGFYLSNKLGMKEYIKNRANRLLIPYAVCACMCIASAFIQSLVQRKSMNEAFRVAFDWVIASILGKGTNKSVDWVIGDSYPRIGLVWFLLTLFWGCILVRKFIDSKYLAIIVALLAYAGIESAKIALLPFDIQQGMVASLFLVIGYYVNKNRVFQSKPDIFTIIIALFLACIAFKYNIANRFATATFKHGLLTIITSCAISYLIIWICVLVDKKSKYLCNILAFFGRNTVSFMVFHCWEITFIKWKIFYQNHNVTNTLLLNSLVFVSRFLFVLLCVVIIYSIPRVRRIFVK